MEINEVTRGIIFRDDEAKKEKLTGDVRIILNYQDGGITKARIEKNGPLIPGAPAKPLNSDGRSRHGG